jgi:hypothetical protein
MRKDLLHFLFFLKQVMTDGLIEQAYAVFISFSAAVNDIEFRIEIS